MLLIAGLGFYWVSSGRPSDVSFTWSSFFPHLSNINDLAFLTNLLFGLLGIEMSAVHAGDVKNPRRDYPRALASSGILILMTLITSSLAIAIVIPAKQLNLVSGLMDAFNIFFTAYHLNWVIPVMAVVIVIGALSGATAWILGPARGLLVASQDMQLPAFLRYTNKADMPVGILLTQGVIVTILCFVFLLMPTVNSSYWLLSDLTAQLALIFYVIFFVAAIKLRDNKNSVKSAYFIPGGKPVLWLVCGVGLIASILTILVGFLPPSQVPADKVVLFEVFLIAGLVIACSLPWLVRHKKTR
jgi:glutamate:GABA antiporter